MYLLFHGTINTGECYLIKSNLNNYFSLDQLSIRKSENRSKYLNGFVK